MHLGGYQSTQSHDLNVGSANTEPNYKGQLQDLVTCLCIFCLQWAWDASVAVQKALEGHCESMLRRRKFSSSLYLIYLG